jgi:uncharacterized membrane protein YdfJ with MMPL/SSD domain
MEIRDPKLLEVIMDLPNNFDAYKKVASERFDKLQESIEDARYVDLKNGDGNRVKVSKIIPDMKKDIDKIKNAIIDIPDIKESTEFLRDFKKVHKIFKQYRLYHTAIVLIGIIVGNSAKSLIIDLIKEFVR